MRAVIFLTSLMAACVAPMAASQNRSSDARAAELALSNDTLEVRYAGAANVQEVPRSRLTAGILLTEERDFVLDAGLLIPANLNLGPLSLRFGPRAYAALLRDENEDVLALSVGAEGRFDIIRSRGLALLAHAYYAPDILTFGASDNLTDLSARVQMNVSEQLLAFAGMRWFEFDLVDGDGERTLMEEVFVGVGWQF
jgi:YfaZ precursor